MKRAIAIFVTVVTPPDDGRVAQRNRKCVSRRRRPTGLGAADQSYGRRSAFVGYALVAAFAVAAATGCAAGAERDARPDGAGVGVVRDIQLFARNVEAMHPRPFHRLTRASFRRAVDDLVERAPSLSPNQRLVELARLGALLGERDGHTGFFPLDTHSRTLHLYPIRLYAFPEGIYVVGSIGRPQLVGSRLVAVDGVPVAEVVDRVEPLVPRDNEHSLRARAVHFLLTAELLDGLGIARGRQAAFTFVARNGGTGTVRLAAVPAARYRAAFADLFHAMIPVGLPRRPRPQYLARRNEIHWAGLVDADRAVYVAHNATTESTSGLADRVRLLAAGATVERVVVDLRHNPGGDVGNASALLAALGAPPVARKRLFVLTSRTTFSAAAIFIAQLERSRDVTLVGEPTGGSPTLYGDPIPVALPSSGIVLNVAGVYWDEAATRDGALAFEPDIDVALTALDFFDGRDPVLAAALR